MEKPADIRKQWKFSKYSFPGDPPKDFTEEKRATFQQDGTQVPMGSKPQRTCLELAKVYQASISTKRASPGAAHGPLSVSSA